MDSHNAILYMEEKSGIFWTAVLSSDPGDHLKRCLEPNPAKHIQATH